MMNALPPVVNRNGNIVNIQANGLPVGLNLRVTITDPATAAVVHDMEYTIPAGGGINIAVVLPGGGPYEVTIVAPSSPSVPPIPSKGSITQITWEYLI